MDQWLLNYVPDWFLKQGQLKHVMITMIVMVMMINLLNGRMGVKSA